jgi:hypothetical protein
MLLDLKKLFNYHQFNAMVDPNPESSPDPSETLDKEVLQKEVQGFVRDKASDVLKAPDGTRRQPVPDNPQEQALHVFQLVTAVDHPNFATLPGDHDIILTLDYGKVSIQDKRLTGISDGTDNEVICHFEGEATGIPIPREKMADYVLGAYAEDITGAFDGEEKTKLTQHIANIEADSAASTEATVSPESRHPVDSMIGVSLDRLHAKMNSFPEGSADRAKYDGAIKQLQTAIAVPGLAGSFAREVAVNNALKLGDKMPSLTVAQGKLSEAHEATQSEFLDRFDGVISDEHLNSLKDFLESTEPIEKKLLELFNAKSDNPLIKAIHEDAGEDFVQALLKDTDETKIVAFLDQMADGLPEDLKKKWTAAKGTLKYGGIGIGAILMILLVGTGGALVGASKLAAGGGQR